LSIREEYPAIKDELILELADRERLVIITNDKDFSDLVYREKLPFNAGLIFCRLDRVLPNEIGDIILYHIKEYGAEFENRFTVISKGKFRQRDL
jgi:predicted nuclease of predicted toxin-antitoxin system